jgi:pilus assembly protein CpaD
MTAKLSAIGGQRRLGALRLATAGLLAVTLAGCYQAPVAEEHHYPIDYRQRHPITLQEGERTVEIILSRYRGGLTAAQRADVLAFAQQWQREASGGIVIEVPWGGPTDRAATDSMREIHSMFAASGVPQRAVYVRRYKPIRSGLPSIRISYAKLTAKAGPCGLWPNDLGPAAGKEYMENRPYWNLGCATQRNLAAEIDNPSDLVQPRVEQPAYEARRTVVLDNYRKGKSPSGAYDGIDKGKISDLGK